ncbi:accessory gene regulator ArgB-like protein [Desertibacillus haloalkaliphilus]|uniref:accessory gene regulator ArgB-like protein n=1 Tax=Desertibacillus haloalkaliphilus TaxID=1328930 RepID=UPI001C26AEA6|nr:accessory gene regulator B family protein [Desertibacillus haloalkaliphilus]MBU8908749.1 accessory gene regulator B family protein [Desertibacillus haloalkaliphilus]
MFERWAMACADHIKKSNPDETEPHDILVFGFTIVINLLFTFLLALVLGALLGVLALTLQVILSFMLLRVLTGGAHLESSLACSIASLFLISAFVWLPVSPWLMYVYFISTIILIVLYAPYYEPHQVQHSTEWERKKKYAAIGSVCMGMLIYLLFGQPGFVFGSLLQALLLTPASITLTYKLNTLINNGR